LEVVFSFEAVFGFISAPADILPAILAADFRDFGSASPGMDVDPLAVLLVLPAAFEPVGVGFPAAGFGVDELSFLAFVVVATVVGFKGAVFRLPIDF